ncbi:MAG: hypothetical protein KGI38_03050 [Thaumarchaeota archaeon]|nr:hypothetical protein [Nitrososphaerota archaeon]
MRFIDVAIAALIGTSAISGLAVWSPHSPDASSQKLALQSELRDRLVAFIQERGVQWLVRSTPAEACSALAGASNSTFSVSATLGTFSCGPEPPPGRVTATISFRLAPFEVTLVAWSGAGA